jgi:NAD(P) transhydrogenase
LFLSQERALVRDYQHKVLANLDHHHVDVVPGHASFVDPHTVKVEHPRRPPVLLSADAFLIACGSRPFRPSQFDFDRDGIYDSNSFIHADRMPKSLVVVGAGAIGSEYACMMALLGSSVTLIDSTATYLSFLDSEIAMLLQESLVHAGIDVIPSSRIDTIGEGPPFALALDSGRELETDAIVVTAGRIGNTDGLALDKAGLSTDARGLLAVNEKFQTAQPHILAAGDVIGFPSLASTAMEQARLAMVHAFDLKHKQQAPSLLPYGLYTIPECAMVGETEDSAQRQGISHVVARARYRNNARGDVIGDDTGLLKLIYGLPDMRLIGAHMIGEQAIELINIGLMAMQMNAPSQAFIDACFNFPSLAELYKYATYDAMMRHQDGRIGPAVET